MKLVLIMSPNYVPKYIIKRLVPASGVKKIEDILEIKFVNILSPITVSEEFPDDLSGKIKVSIDGKELSEDQIFKTELDIEGKTYKIPELKTLKGKIIPLGAEVFIRVPDPVQMIQSGNTYNFSVWIEETPNLSLDIKRTVN
jgi:hypothetical protein